MDHTVRESVLDSSHFSTSKEHLRQGEASTPNRTTDIEHGPGQSVDLEWPMPQAVTLNQVLGSHDATIGSGSAPNFVSSNNEIESPISSSTANNSASSETLFQDTGLENTYFSFGVDLDSPILIGEPVVEVDFELVDFLFASIGEFPPITGSMFDGVSMTDIEAVDPTAFSMTNSLNPPSLTGQSTINGQPEIGAMTTSSSLRSSQDPQQTKEIAKAINAFSKQPNQVKHLVPKQHPIHPPGSTSTREKQGMSLYLASSD